MAYNQITYDQAAYNYPGEETFVLLQIESFETVDCICKATETTSFSLNSTESFNNESHISIGKILTVIYSESINCEASMYTLAEIELEFEEIFNCEAELASSIAFSLNSSENLTNSSFICFLAKLYSEFNEQFNGDVKIAKKVTLELELYEIVDCIAEAESTEEFTLVVNVSIPPGKTLIVDSEYYTAYLDGINVLDKVTGDWLDELTRESVSITINCGNSNSIATALLYKELYL